MTEWSREALTERILADVKGMWELADRGRHLSADELVQILMAGLTEYRRHQDANEGIVAFTTHDLVKLAVVACHLAREVTLEQQAKEAS